MKSWPNSSSVCGKIKKMLDDFLHQQGELGEQQFEVLMYVHRTIKIFLCLLMIGNYGSSIAILSVLIELELLKHSSDSKCTKQIVRQSIACKIPTDSDLLKQKI